MNSDFRLDLHTHSIISYDGGISRLEYERFFSDKKNFVAITDHNEISLAKELKNKIGDQVIVGEEIMTLDGEIIGLFLETKIEPGLSASETIAEIKKQNGLVYIPHPLETMRKGLQLEVLKQVAGQIDIVETFNARVRQPHLQKLITDFTLEFTLEQTASSDAHGVRGLGSAYAKISHRPTRENLKQLLQSAELIKNRASIIAFLYPLKNKIFKKLKI